VVVAVAFTLATFYAASAERALLEQGELKNANQLRLILNHWSDAERATAHELLAAPGAPKPDAAIVAALRESFLRSVVGTTVLKLKLYNTRGITVFSSDPGQIGEDKSTYHGVVVALGGNPSSQLMHRERFDAFEGSRADVWVIGSYLPLRDAGGKVFGAVELYDDVTPLAATIARTRWLVMGLTGVLMLGLYLALLLIVRRADQILSEKHLLEQRMVEQTKHSAGELRQALDAAEKARREAETANRAKSAFLAAMSHELRTPMHGVIGMTDVLLQDNLTDKQRRQLQVVRNSASSLLRLLSDLLEFSRLESDRIELHAEPLSPADLAQEVVATFLPQARAKGLALGCRVARDVPPYALGDATRLRQVLGNLVGNALKFTQHGAVDVEIERMADAADLTLRFAVRDTGIGIPLDRQSAIFDPFVQADASIAQRFGGTGLGLSICKRLVEMMGGTIELVSEVGTGSVFTFTVRLQPSAAAPAVESPARVPTSASKAVGASLLLVEDNPVNQMVAREMLALAGCEVTVAANGEEALAKLRSRGFDLVFMDLQMSGIDGIETTRRLRELERELQRPAAVVVAVTANAMQGSREACLQAGMNDYLAKPFTVEEVLAAVNRNLRPARRAAA
jgi:signal transduction histidine kinase/ActR/RegA family two-component response regulator